MSRAAWAACAAWAVMAGTLLFPSAAKAQTSWGMAVTGDGPLSGIAGSAMAGAAAENGPAGR